jgi:Cu/Ag efflux pump CusA
MAAQIQLQRCLAVGYIALFRIAVETGVVMVVYLHEALERRLQSGKLLTSADVEAAAIESAVQRLRPKLMTVCAVLASLVPSPGIRHRLRRHETDRRADRGRHDYFHHPTS